MLSGKFENCYGLKSFELKEINFTDSNKAIIYAPNGVMKTSFSNVFDDISMIKHLIAIKELKMPLDEFVDYGALAEFYRNCDRVETFIKKMNDKQWAKNRNLLMNFEYNREIFK